MTDNDNASVNEKNVKIFVRIFPVERSCESCARIDTERKKIYVRCLQEMQPNRIVTIKKPSYWCFQADAIFCDSSQEEVYHVTTEDLVPKILDGVSCVLMGYGQTGSGKSFTINGLRNNWEHRGLVARLLSHMFIEKANRKKVSKIEYCVSFIELYGKEARDLLTCNMDNRVKINERDPFKDISMLSMDNEKEGLRRIFEGESRRLIVKGSTYPASHLATAVITFHVSNTSLITSWGVVTTAKVMHIVEVAGTGKIGRNNCLKTAMDIGMANLTKTQLEQFFSCIGNSGMSAISIIRSSNLLKILRNAFSVSSIVRFISHIQITKEDLGITLSTLRLTAKIGKLKPIRMKEDVKYRSDLMVHRLQDEVNALKKELMINNLFLHQEAFMNISKSRMEQINRNILNFLNDKISDFTLFSASQAQVLLKNIKNLYNRLAAKELEVEELKETYESLVKSVTQFSTSENLPMETVISTDDYTNNRKRIKSSSQVTEAEKIIQEMEKEEVGSLDKSRREHILKIDSQNIVMVAKRNLDDARDKLDKHQQIRYVLELGNHERTKIIIEIEKTIERDILCHRKVLVNLEEEVNQAQDEITTLSNQHLEMISKLESAFREYCKKKDFLVYYTDESMKMLLKPTTTESLEIIRCKFNKFQRAMLRKTEVNFLI
ncbi:Kinesin-like protein KIF9 [Habropoda laboriosa]|uniref:Kinesin-like protein KIF9 n=1 Tax=Habropoda laboriosa TaxID=597456 RepID=A0A0L7QYK0_9HYME|nr:Kinesin-like protein KIF9 [Habropoda laboriosa]